MKLQNMVFLPVVVPANIVSSLLSYPAKSIRENYIRKKYSKSVVLDNILYEYKALAQANGIILPNNMAIRVIKNPQQSTVSKWFEDFSDEKHVYCHFNTILVNEKFIKKSDYQQLKRAIINSANEVYLNLPFRLLSLDNILQVLIISSLVLAKLWLPPTNLVTIGLITCYGICSLIRFGINKLAEKLGDYKAKKITQKIIGVYTPSVHPLSTPLVLQNYIITSTASPVIPEPTTHSNHESNSPIDKDNRRANPKL